MNGSALAAALAVEIRKTAASPVMRTTTVLVVAGIALLAGALTLAATNGNDQIIAKLGPNAEQGEWALLTGTVAQITAAGGLLGFGVALSWTIGREFNDGTITGLFALPVSRPIIALAKLLVHLLWITAVAVTLTVLTGTVGLALRLGALDADVRSALARQFMLTVLTGLLATAAAWAATIGRGLLPGIATTIGLIVAAQIMIVAGAGAWFPVAAPALWGLDPATVSGPQLALVAAVPLGFGALTLHAWARLELDR